MSTLTRPGRGDRGRDVAVADQVDARAGRTQLGDQVDVALALEDDDVHVARRLAERLRDRVHVLGRRGLDVDRVERLPRRRRSSPCRPRRRGRTSSRARRARSRRSRSAARARSGACPRAGRPRRRPPGPVPSPTSSPLKSIGASSFSPSPITTVPRIATVSSIARIPSTAAWSADSFSPRPIQRPAASAPASVTRTSSSARFRSGPGAGPRLCGRRAHVRILRAAAACDASPVESP